MNENTEMDNQKMQQKNLFYICSILNDKTRSKLETVQVIDLLDQRQADIRTEASPNGQSLSIVKKVNDYILAESV